MNSCSHPHKIICSKALAKGDLLPVALSYMSSNGDYSVGTNYVNQEILLNDYEGALQLLRKKVNMWVRRVGSFYAEGI